MLSTDQILFMESTDDPCEEMTPSHTVYHRGCAKYPAAFRQLGDEFTHPSLSHLQISPHDLSAVPSPFQHVFSVPDVSRVTLLELPPSNPEKRHAGRDSPPRSTQHSDVDIITTQGMDDSWCVLHVLFIAVQRLVVHPTASVTTVLCVLLPTAPYDYPTRLSPR